MRLCICQASTGQCPWGRWLQWLAIPRILFIFKRCSLAHCDVAMISGGIWLVSQLVSVDQCGGCMNRVHADSFCCTLGIQGTFFNVMVGRWTALFICAAKPNPHSLWLKEVSQISPSGKNRNRTCMHHSISTSRCFLTWPRSGSCLAISWFAWTCPSFLASDKTEQY